MTVEPAKIPGTGPARPAAAPDCADLYLDLLLEALIGRLQADPSIDPWSPATFDAERRAFGRDWPRTAPSMIGAHRMRHLRGLCEAALGRGIPGDFAEAGVWRGGSCIMMRGLLRAYGVADRRVFVCDSFEGLPPPDPAVPPDQGDELHRFPELAVPLDEVRANFARFRLLDEQVVFIKGFFERSLADAPIRRLALLRVDADMFSSTLAVLRALGPRVSPGGYIVVDDYGVLPACRSAVAQFREEQGVSSPIVDIDGTGVFWEVAGGPA